MTMQFAEMLGVALPAGGIPPGDGPGTGAPRDAELFLQALSEAQALAAQGPVVAATAQSAIESLTAQLTGVEVADEMLAETMGDDGEADAAAVAVDGMTLALLEAQLALLLGVQAGTGGVPQRSTPAQSATTPSQPVMSNPADPSQAASAPVQMLDALIILEQAASGGTAHTDAASEGASQDSAAAVVEPEDHLSQQVAGPATRTVVRAAGQLSQVAQMLSVTSDEVPERLLPIGLEHADAAAPDSAEMEAGAAPEQSAPASNAARETPAPPTVLEIVAARTSRKTPKTAPVRRDQVAAAQERLPRTVGDEGGAAAAATRPPNGSEMAVAPSPVELDRVMASSSPKMPAAGRLSGGEQPVRASTLGALADHTVRNVRFLAESGGTSLTVRLVPESLGEMRIEVHATSDGLAVRLASASSAVRGALEAHTQSLRDALQRDGVEVSHIEVAADLARHNGQRQADDGATQRTLAFNRSYAPNRGWRYEGAVDEAPTIRHVSRHYGAVDVFV